MNAECHPDRRNVGKGLCRSCYGKSHYYTQRTPRKKLQYHIKHRYNLTIDDYDRMILESQGRCCICDDPAELEIEHDHKTGRVRGLTCKWCNTRLAWLEKHQEKIMNHLNGPLAGYGWGV